MKLIKIPVSLKVLVALWVPALIIPKMAEAQLATGGTPVELRNIFVNSLEFINDVLVPVIIGVGFMIFVWGMIKYFVLGGADEKKQEEGKALMIYATLGFLLIIVFWGVVNLLASSIGLQGESLENLPKVQTI